MGEKVKGLRSTDWWLQSSPGDAKSSIVSTVYTIVITVHGARWVWELLGGSLPKFYKCPTAISHRRAHEIAAHQRTVRPNHF